MSVTEREIELSNRIKAGGDDGKAAQGELAVDFLYLTEEIAKGYKDTDMDEDDLIGMGEEAIFLAAGTYDAASGVGFAEYATERIKAAIDAGLSDEHASIEASQEIINQMSAVKVAEAELEKELGHEPTDIEIADRMGLTEEQISTIKAYILEIIRSAKDKEKSNEEVMEDMD